MITTFKCDYCKKDFGNDQLNVMYDIQYCNKCKLERKISYLDDKIKRHTKWLNETKLKHLKDLKEDRKELKKTYSELYDK